MSRSPIDRFEELAKTLSARDRDVPAGLAGARQALEALRVRAADAIARFSDAARALDADHLTEIRVSEVEPDEKHVDCVQLRIERGRFELVLVGKAKGVVTIVGPFKRGKVEKPCHDHEIGSAGLAAALDERLLALLEEASAR